MGEVIEFPVVRHEQLSVWPLAVNADYIVGQSCHLTLCPEVTTDVREYAPQYSAFNADDSPWLRGIRASARHDGEQLYAERRQKMFDGAFDDVVLDVDAVGTAAKVAGIASTYGHNSAEYNEARNGLLTDCSRKIGEASRKNSWEYFSRTTQRYDPDTDQLYAHGMSVDVMIDNGISPLVEAEEVTLRINDKVNHHTSKGIIKTPNIGTIATLRLSPCPDWAHESLKHNPNSAHGGYAPEIDKLMINYDIFDTAAQEVHHEQFGLSGIYITPDVMQEVLRSVDIVSRATPMNRTEIHATVGVMQGAHAGSVLDIVQLLDTVASEKTGLNIFLGEAVQGTHVKDYGSVVGESQARQQEQAALSQQLAEYVEQLQASAVDHAVATQLVEKFIQEKLLDVVEQNPAQAEIIFNKQTAVRFQQASDQAKLGNLEAAEELRAEARIKAPPSSSCGAGNCGLEGVDVNSAEGASLKKQLKAESGDTIVKDTVRSCKNCGEKAVVYAFNKGKVNKACTSCNAFEQKRTK